MNKFAIYTACIGGYDNIVQPEVIDERFDYFLFTDDVRVQSIGVWQVRQVEYTNSDKIRIARYVKTHPKELLPEYKATLWMDANIQMISVKMYERFKELYNNNTEVASICHPYRDCIYDEAFEVSYSKKYGKLERDTIAIKWCHYIYKENYPVHNGLFETGILYRKNTEPVNMANDLWWDCISNYSRRDQLSFNYAIWKYKLNAAFFLPIGEHAQHSNDVRYIPHGQVSRRKFVNADFLEQWRYKAINFSESTLKVGQSWWRKTYSSKRPLMALEIYGLLLGLYVSPCLIYNVIKHRIIRVIK